MSSADVSVVICAHDEGRWEQIQAAIRSVENQSVSAREVVIVVDHNDRLLQRIRAEMNVLAVPNRGVRGVGGARNTGIVATSGAVVAYLDDDAAACPDWIGLISEPYVDELVVGVGGGAKPVWATARPSWFPPEFDWVVGCSYLGMPQSSQEVRNLFGCNMSYRREVLEILGGFRLGYSCDETEFCIRLHQRWPDKKLLYLPDASVAHYVPASRTKVRRYLSRCYFEGGSKAVVTRLVGADHGLSDERNYTSRILPSGVRRGAQDFVLQRDLSGLGRAAAIVGGLMSTVAGYASGQMMIGRTARRRGWQGDFGPQARSAG